ncbi:hypothetical protein PR003_g8026 [Phytophthora rubi]|uniref:Uncharacterized protein n=1 Tax=Phytophthora rubi TaxID=129364 RepID=A0A6A4FYS7_9STRA|nr:hypothetical protein PR003_g8026 [Phytophthora rubi]
MKQMRNLTTLSVAPIKSGSSSSKQHRPEDELYTSSNGDKLELITNV